MDEIERLKQEVERLTRELNYATMNEEESEEISAELFALCCAVVDGKPDAAASRDKLQEHIKHVQSCRRGSCATELGETQKARADAAENKEQHAEQRIEALTDGRCWDLKGCTYDGFPKCPWCQLDAAEAEVERLTHLHDLDHKLADFWFDQREKARAERDALTERVKRLDALLRRGGADDAVCVCHLHFGGCWPCEVKAALAGKS